MTNHYKLGLEVGRKKRRGEYWLSDIPVMSLEETVEFNRGFDRGESEPSIGAKLFVSALAIIVILAIVSFVK